MKNVLVLGAGISGLGAAHVLLRHECNVIVSDLKDNIKDKKEKEILQSFGVVFEFGMQSVELLDGIDTVVVSPVISAENIVVMEAFKRRIPVISEIELAYRVTKAPILAVTGTNGKTTTTTLLGSMIGHSSIPFAVAGNLGISLSREAELVAEDGVIAAEVSSFQLEFIKDFCPRAAVILNITPDHIERHHTMERYVAAKARIFENMGKDNCLLLNAEDEYTPILMKKAKNTTVCLSSISRDVEEGACLNGADLVIKRRGKVLKVAGIDELQLTGNQNYQNVLAAAFLAYEGGIPLEAIHDGIIEFKGLSHRIEFVRELDGVSYYNDSKATNTDAAIKGMETFDRPIILIAGGYDKHTKLDKFMKTVKARVKCLILLGNAAARFKDEAEKAGIKTIVLADDMRGAVEKGKSIACSGDVVLLSPACSSFDMYANYEARGFDFKKIVNRLK